MIFEVAIINKTLTSKLAKIAWKSAWADSYYIKIQGHKFSGFACSYNHQSVKQFGTRSGPTFSRV